MSWLERMVERRVLKAKAEGQLERLEGEGEPLPDRSGEAHLDAGEAAGFRMMKEAGVLPPEIVLKKEIAAQRERLAGIEEPEARKAAMAELSKLMLRLAIAEESRRKFLRY